MRAASASRPAARGARWPLAAAKGPHDGLTKRQKRELNRPYVPREDERRLAISLLEDASSSQKKTKLSTLLFLKNF